MNPIVFHIVSGQSFFTGIGLILAVVWLPTMRKADKPLASPVRLSCIVCFTAGLLGIALSSTPIPYWYYAFAAAITLTWLIARKRPASRVHTRIAMTVVWLGAAALELPWHFLPPRASIISMSVIGDSVSAGMEENEAETWPSLLARQRKLAVQDISHVGETAASALKRARQRGIQGSFVLVEIGGNDILGSTTPQEFAVDLEALLSFLTAENREVVMFELPLPPFFHEYGRIQRMLSTRYSVKLIPKRIFLSILAGNDSTLDTIHLSPEGHQQMADLVWTLIRKSP